MITGLRIQNFKSWEDTGAMRFAPITGFFGANSSGKTSILQFLLVLKQTIESTERGRVLFLGDANARVNLGTYVDVIHQHDLNRALMFALTWDLSSETQFISSISDIKMGRLEVTIRAAAANGNAPARMVVERLEYQLDDTRIGMERTRPIQTVPREKEEYKLDFTPGQSLLMLKHVEPQVTAISRSIQLLPTPGKFYGLPGPNVIVAPANELEKRGVEFVLLMGSELAASLERAFKYVLYLGPLREYPRRIYLWGGDYLSDVGQRGEEAISALLASRNSEQEGEAPVEEKIAEWLRRMDLIHDFSLKPIAPGRKEYEVRVRHKAGSPEVLLSEVGFGVSQILPVLVLCYYAPEGSTLLLEQPDIHLHPAAQYWLADVFIEVTRARKLQIIFESHSEHLLERLQRRIAEGKFSSDQASLYFCQLDAAASQISALEMDSYGNIVNWPRDFFGDQMGETSARTASAIERELRDREQS